MKPKEGQEYVPENGDVKVEIKPTKKVESSFP